MVRTDRHYTQGAKLSYLHADGVLPLGSAWLHRHLPEVGFESEVGRFGYSVGQNIYTPAEIEVRPPLPDDRPYAGWLYVGAILQRRGWSRGQRLVEEDLEIELGVIGPWAAGEEAQNWVHDIRDIPEAQGWDHQLKNEPGVRLKYSRAVRWWEREWGNFGVDVSPRVGVSLGNVETSARAGGLLRVGFNLPDDFGYHFIDSLATTAGGHSKQVPVRWSLYGFASAEGRLVAHAAMLDGNLFHHGPSVSRQWLVGDVALGVAGAWRGLEAGYAHLLRSSEFHGQSGVDSFGSVFLNLRF